MRNTILHIFIFLATFPILFQPSVASCEELNVQNQEQEGFSLSSGALKLMKELSMLHRNIRIGPVSIKPSYQINEVFDDNVFDGPDNEVEDFYTLHRPALELIAPFSDRLLTHLRYNVEIYDYERIKERDRVNQSLESMVELYFANDFSLSISDRLRKHRIPPGVQRRFFADIADLDIPIEDQGINVFVTQRDVITNFANVDLDLPDVFPYFDFSLHYENRNVSYKRSQFDGIEYNTNTINADVIYEYPFAPITLSSGFIYSIQRYDSNKNLDARRKGIPFDIVWNFTPKNELYLNTNYKSSKYNKQSTIENFEGWEVVVGNLYSITPVSSIEIYAERSVKEQRLEDNNAYFDTVAGIKYKMKHRRFEGYIDVQYFNLKFFETNEQLEDEEEVDGVSVNLNLKYYPQKWWFAEFDYTFNRRDSTASLGDLTKNTVSLGLGMSF